MSIVINGKKIEVPGLKTTSHLDGVAHIKYMTDCNPRKQTIRMIIAHTHKGIKGKLLPGTGPNSTTDDALARYQNNTGRHVSWDYTIDKNGDVIAQSDPAKTVAWHAGQHGVNERSLGFEIVQNEDGSVYEGQIDKVVLLIDALTALLGIQRQIVWDSSKGSPKVGIEKRLQMDGGADFVGVAGHRNTSRDRGPGDPGDYLFLALQKAGYECFDLSKGEDLKVWKDRQRALGIPETECDGIPLKKTVEALKQAGHKHGLWVKRPVDDLLP
jgi:hypothetical protein